MEIEGSGVVTNAASPTGAAAGRGRRLKASTPKDGTRRPGALISKQKRQDLEASEKEKEKASSPSEQQQEKTNNNSNTTTTTTTTTENRIRLPDGSNNNKEVSRPGGFAEGRPTPPSSPNSLGRGGGGRGRVIVSNRAQPTRRPSNQKIEVSDEEEEDDDEEDDEEDDEDDDDNKQNKNNAKDRSKNNSKKLVGKEEDEEDEEEDEDEDEDQTDTSDEESGGGSGGSSRSRRKEKESNQKRGKKGGTTGQSNSRTWARRRKRALTPSQPPRPTATEPEYVLPPYPNPNGENYGVATRPGDNKRYTRCRRCCLYKVQVPSKKEHVCREDLIEHKWEQCPTKNKRAHMKELINDNQEEGSKSEGVARRGESIVLRKTGGAVTTQRLQQGRGKTSWFNLQRRRIVFSDAEADKHKQIL